MAVSVVAVIATCLLQSVGMSARREQNAIDTRRAFYLAEAGLAEAYGGIRIGKTGNVGTAARPAVVGEGIFWVEASAPVDGRIELKSTGMRGVGQVSLSMVVEKGEQSVASLGVFSSLTLNIPPGSTIQGFDSSQETAALATGRLGSNETIAATGTMKQPTTIRADLITGPRQLPSLGSYVTHTGGIEARDAAVMLPPVEVPSFPAASGVDHTGAVPLVLPAGDVSLAYLRVAADSQVIAQGPCNLVVNDLTLSPGASLEFDTQLGPIRLWVRGSLTLSDGSEISCSDTDTSRILVQLPSSNPAELSATGRLYGVVYAPAAEVTVGRDFRQHGALIARRLVVMPGAQLAFDQHLDEAAQEAQIPKLISWRILELANSTGPGGVRDPFGKLGLDPSVLPKPADAHEDQVLDVAYRDLGGNVTTYAGMESGFDWTNVQDVDALSRDGVAVAVPPPDVLKPPPPPISPAMTAIKDTNLDSSQLKSALISASPLTAAELMASIQRNPGLSSSDLQNVLQVNEPLSSAVLLAAIDRRPAMSQSDLKNVLDRATPLPTDVLARVITDQTILPSNDRKTLLEDNGILEN